MTTFALILAGGEGSRLGHVRKANLRLGGKTLLERVTVRLQDDVETVFVSSGNSSALPDGLPDIRGAVSGPLAGVAAAVAHLRDRAEPKDVLVTVAVDTPFLPCDFVRRLEEPLVRAPASFAQWRDDFYPTNAAYRLGAILDLPENMEALFSPKRVLEPLGAEPVRWDHLSDDPFANLNTLSDLVALARRSR
jgi:molybdenum cofactor guanylyltransferase